MSELQNGLKGMFDVLKDLETRARNLKNQNFADIAASAHGKIKQLTDHPDLELVEGKPAEEEQVADHPDLPPPSHPVPFPQSQPSRRFRI